MKTYEVTLSVTVEVLAEDRFLAQEVEA